MALLDLTWGEFFDGHRRGCSGPEDLRGGCDRALQHVLHVVRGGHGTQAEGQQPGQQWRSDRQRPCRDAAAAGIPVHNQAVPQTVNPDRAADLAQVETDLAASRSG